MLGAATRVLDMGVPWETPTDFSVARYADRLLALHEATGEGPLTLTRTRFRIGAVRT